MTGSQPTLVDPKDTADLVAVAAVLDADDFLLQTRRHGQAWADEKIQAAGAVMAEVLSGHHDVAWHFVPPDQWVITFVSSPFQALYDSTIERLRRLQTHVQQATGLTTSVAVSRPQEGSHAVALAVQEAQQTAMSKLVLGGNQIFQEQSVAELRSPPSRIDRELVQPIRAGDRAAVARLVMNWIDECAAQPGVTAAQLQEWILAKLLFILDLVSTHRMGTGSTDWFAVKASLLRDLVEVAEIHERSYLQMWVNDVIDQILQPRARASASGATVVQAAETYIAQHFSDPDLQLTSLARELSVSPYHLAHLFRRERNTTFLRVLTGQRMRVARHLLSTTDLPVQRIAELTGHTSAKRFRAVFKREVGCNPTDYRSAESDAS